MSLCGGTSGSLYDLSGPNQIKNTYPRLVQVAPSPTGSFTPYLYDGKGNRINGVRFQEAFERDGNGDLQPTEGPFLDNFWEEDSNGDKTPRDIKFWLDSNFNLIPVPN